MFDTLKLIEQIQELESANRTLSTQYSVQANENETLQKRVIKLETENTVLKRQNHELIERSEILEKRYTECLTKDKNRVESATVKPYNPEE